MVRKERQSMLLDPINRNNHNRGFSQAFYRERLYEKAMGFKDLEDFMAGYWEKWACSKGKCTYIRSVGIWLIQP